MNYKELTREIEQISMRIWAIAKEAENESEAMIIVTNLKAVSNLLDAVSIEFQIKAEKPF